MWEAGTDHTGLEELQTGPHCRSGFPGSPEEWPASSWGGATYSAGETGDRMADNSWRRGQGAECHLVFAVPRPETLSHPGC